MIRNFVLQSAVGIPGANPTVQLGPKRPDRLQWSDAYPDGSAVFYFMDDGSQAEWGVGTFRSGQPSTISRDTIIGNTVTPYNQTPQKLNFLGATDIYNEIPGERLPYINGQVVWAPGAHLDPHAGGVPIGASMDYWGVSAPTGWAFCDGRWLSRVQYALLFSVISTTYGAGDGVSYFNLPDCQGVATYGSNNPSGSGIASTRLGPWQNSAMGAKIGDWQSPQHSHPLNWDEHGGHNHGFFDPGHVHTYRHVGFRAGTDFFAGAGYSAFDDGTYKTTDGIAVQTGAYLGNSATGVTASVGNAGTGAIWQNVSPGIICAKIIYTGPVP